MSADQPRRVTAKEARRALYRLDGGENDRVPLRVFIDQTEALECAAREVVDAGALDDSRFRSLGRAIDVLRAVLGKAGG